MNFTRRGWLAGVAASLAGLKTAQASGSNRAFRSYPGRLGLLHDSTLCIGCRSCEAACNNVNSLGPPADPLDDPSVFERTRKLSTRLYTVVNRYMPAQGRRAPVYRKHQCMHCNEPCCASVCFVKAFIKTPEGPVLYDPDLCVGCRYCVFVCPYYALTYEFNEPATPRVGRCTMCYPRIRQGLQPACAEACPAGAIQYGRRDDLLELARARIRKYPDRYRPHIFGENEWGGTSWLTIYGQPLATLDLPDEPSHAPLPTLITGHLSLAPVAAAIVPGLLAGIYALAHRRDEGLPKNGQRPTTSLPDSPTPAKKKDGHEPLA